MGDGWMENGEWIKYVDTPWRTGQHGYLPNIVECMHRYPVFYPH